MEQLNSNNIEPRETTRTGLGMTRHHKPVAWMVLTILLVAVCAGLAYLWYTTQRTLNDKDKQLTASVSESAKLKETVQQLREEVSGITVKAKQTDEEQIRDVMLAYYHAAGGKTTDVYEVKIMKLSLPYAWVAVGVKDQVGGSGCVLKKSDSMWLRLFCAQNTTPEIDNIMDLYSVPRSIIES